MPSRRPRVLLGLTGSVACVKAEELVRALQSWADVRCCATPAALHFLPPGATALAGAQLFLDAHEWAAWRGRGDPVLHISLRRWADLLLIAPLSANCLSKLAGGQADGLLLCVARAWDWRGGRPVLVAPAMNTEMWEHPLTAQARRRRRARARAHAHVAPRGAGLARRRHRAAGEQAVRVPPPEVPPLTRLSLICGDVGLGAMAEVAAISSAAREALAASERAGSAAAEEEAAGADAELNAAWAQGAAPPTD